MKRLAGAIAAACVLTAALGPAAPAQEDSATSGYEIRLASKTPWVGPGGELVLRLDIEASRADETELAVSVHGRVTSRSAFERTLTTAPRGSALTVVSAPLSQLGPDPAGALVVRLPVQAPGQPRDANRLLLSREGVYPVRVELRELGGGEVLAGMTTHLLYVPGENEAALGAALVLPVHAPPTTRADGRRAVPDLDRLRPLTAALAAQNLGLTIDPTPETVEALAAAGAPAQELVGALRAAVRGRQVVGGTYVRVDQRALLAAGLEDELTAQVTRGARVLSEVLAVRPDPRTWIVEGGLDTSVLEAARSAQVDRIVVQEDALERIDLNVTLAQPFVLEARRGGSPFRTLAIDPGLASHFAGDVYDDDSVLAAHNVLADLAVIHFDSPGTLRAVVVAPPLDWVPRSDFLDTLLGGLNQSPVLEPLTLDEAFEVPAAERRRGVDLVREIVTDDQPSRLPRSAIRAARAETESFAGLVDAANPVADALDRSVLSAGAAGLRAAARNRLLAGVSERIEAQFSQISLPGNRSVTLTARTGEIPITIQSGLDYPVRARLRVESDKLAFPEGSRRELELDNTNTTERFAVRARTSGAFPLRVVLESPDGDLVLGRSLFTVRSTAASGVGVALSAGAAGFLALWWSRHLVQARRTRRAASSEPA